MRLDARRRMATDEYPVSPAAFDIGIKLEARHGKWQFETFRFMFWIDSRSTLPISRATNSMTYALQLLAVHIETVGSESDSE